MPLLEIVQIRQVTARSGSMNRPPRSSTSMRLFFTPQPMRSWTRRSPMSSPKTASSRSFFALLKPRAQRRAFASAACPRTALLPSLRMALRTEPSQWRSTMIRACAANHSGVSIPFGAAHRVNFDTPPLEGSCSSPFGSYLALALIAWDLRKSRCRLGARWR